MFRWNFLCFSPRISTSSVDYGEFTAGAIQSSRFQLQYSKTKLENRGVDQWLCWRQQNSSLLLAVSKCRDVLAKCFYIRDIFKPTATAHIQIIVQEKTTKTQNIPVPLWILLICLTIVIAQSPLPPSLPPFPLARVKILKNFCVRTPRRSVGSLNATVSVIKVDTVSVRWWYLYLTCLTSNTNLKSHSIKDHVLAFHSFIPSRNGGGRWQGGEGKEMEGGGRDVPRSPLLQPPFRE